MPAVILDPPRLRDVERDSPFSLIEILNQIFAGHPGYERALDAMLDRLGNTR